MKKVLIVEDEMLIANSISESLSTFNFTPLEPAITYTEAIDRIERESPDIGILDIHLSGNKSGIDLAETINKKYGFPVIFLTSNSDEATLEEVMKVKPSAFLTKPFNTEELYAAIKLTLYKHDEAKNINSSNSISDSLFIKDKDSFIRIKYDDIIFLKSDNIYIEIKTLTNSFIIRSSLHEYERKLPENFIRVHRSYVINLNFLQQFNSQNITINGINIPIGNKYKELLLSTINK